MLSLATRRCQLTFDRLSLSLAKCFGAAVFRSEHNNQKIKSVKNFKPCEVDSAERFKNTVRFDFNNFIKFSTMIFLSSVLFASVFCQTQFLENFFFNFVVVQYNLFATGPYSCDQNGSVRSVIFQPCVM